MITRDEYMANSAAEWAANGTSTGAAFHAYYSQFVTAESLRVIGQVFTREQLLAALEKDKHLNTIPLARWESLTWHPVATPQNCPTRHTGGTYASFQSGAFRTHFPYNVALRKAADSYGVTRADIVCIAKTAARMFANSEH